MRNKVILSVLIVSLIAVFIGCNAASKKSLTPPNQATQKKYTGPLTYVPAGQQPEDYVKKYYDLYVAGKFDESYKLLPGEKRAQQTKDQYVKMHQGLKASSYKMGPKKVSNQIATIVVTLNLGGNLGKWNVTWYFVQHQKGWVVVDYKAGEVK